LTQVPTVPWSAHVTHVPVHALLQQTPSAQKPVAHSAAIVHELPIGLPGISAGASPGWSTGASVAGTSGRAPSPCATSLRMSVPASSTRLSPPPPQPAVQIIAPSNRTAWTIRA
jgi:hypothetical protein